MDDIRTALYEAAEAEHPVTVRRLFYRLVSDGVIPKTEAAYQGTVIRLLGEMRERGDLPFEWITDGTRLRRKPTSFQSLQHALDTTTDLYRRALWDEQASYVEIWCEKVGMSGVLYPVTSEWDVPLMLCGGSPSKTFLHEAGEEIEAVSKQTWIYYLGDFDPSGLAISARVERDLKRYAPNSEIHFYHLAVTRTQISEYDLPTRPTKGSDPNAKRFRERFGAEQESVEVDAIDANELRRLVRIAIESHVDARALERTKRIENAERGTLKQMVDVFAQAGAQ
jgi:hypothetical protein